MSHLAKICSNKPFRLQTLCWLIFPAHLVVYIRNPDTVTRYDLPLLAKLVLSNTHYEENYYFSIGTTAGCNTIY